MRSVPILCLRAWLTHTVYPSFIHRHFISGRITVPYLLKLHTVEWSIGQFHIQSVAKISWKWYLFFSGANICHLLEKYHVLIVVEQPNGIHVVRLTEIWTSWSASQKSCTRFRLCCVLLWLGAASPHPSEWFHWHPSEILGLSLC